MTSRARIVSVSAALAALLAVWAWLDASPDGRPAVAVDASRPTRPLQQRATTGEPKAIPEPGSRVPLAEADRAVETRAPVSTRLHMHLTVVDDLSVPLADTVVAATVDGERLERTTDAAGTCLVPLPDPGGRLHLWIEKEGHFHRKAYYTHLSELTVTLPRLVRLSGRVLAADTLLPLPDATVQVSHGSCKQCPRDEVRMDALGAYTHPRFPVSRKVRVTARAPGFGAEVANVFVRDIEQHAERTFHLERTTRVHGVAVDVLSGLAVPGATFVRSDREVRPDGSFSLHSVLKDTRRIGVHMTADGYCQSYGGVLVENPDEVFEVPLLPGALVQGRVTDPDGRPLSDVGLRFDLDYGRDAREGHREMRAGKVAEALGSRPVRIDFDPAADRAVTDASGLFRSASLVPWTPYEVRVGKRGYLSRELALPVLGGPSSTLSFDVVLEAVPQVEYATVSGVLRLNGRPIGGTLRWECAGDSGYAKVQPSGRFTMKRLPAGTLEIRPLPEDRGGRGNFDDLFYEKPPLTIDVGPGDELEHDLDVELEMRPIAGRVLAGDDSSLAGVGIGASSDDPPFWCDTKTDDDGSFTLEVPAEGHPLYRVGLTRGRTHVWVEGVPPGADDLELALPAVGLLRVRVSDPSSGHIVSADLYWRRGSDDFRSLYEHSRSPAVDVEGWFETPLGTGSVDLLARTGRGGTVVLSRADVAEDRTSSIEIPLRPGIAATFALTGPMDEAAVVVLAPVEHADEVAQWLRSGGTYARPDHHSFPLARVIARVVEFDERGRANVERLAAGRYRWIVHPRRFALQPAEFVLGDGMESPMAVSSRSIE